MEINIKLLKIQNPWWESHTLKYDPVIEALLSASLKYVSPVIRDIDMRKSKISVVSGARGVGKTSIMKMMIQELIDEKKVNPENIFYYSCHNLNSKEQLSEIIKTFLAERKLEKKQLYIFIDEVTLLKRWEAGIDHLSRAGLFKNASLVLSGSLKTWQNDKNMSPVIKTVHKVTSLSFREFLVLADDKLLEKLDKDKKNFFKYKNRVEYYLDIYMLTGGYVSAINSFLKEGRVRQSIYSSYLYWLVTDIARVGRDLILFRQIIDQLISLRGQVFGYKTLARKTRAKTHNTVAEYIKIMQSMFAVQGVHQYKQGGGVNKSAKKKMYFRDPFNFWVFTSYIYGSLSYWQFAREYIHDENIFSHLLETIVYSHLLKEEKFSNWGECIAYERDKQKNIDIPFVDLSKKTHMPILMRYKEEITKSDRECFKKSGFKKGIIISRDIFEETSDTNIWPLPYFLLYY